MWVMVSTICEDCGGDMQIKLCETKPTEQDEWDFSFSGTCSRSYTIELDQEGVGRIS